MLPYHSLDFVLTRCAGLQPGHKGGRMAFITSHGHEKSFRDIAKATKLSRWTVSGVLRGTRGPSVISLQLIAQYLGYTETELLHKIEQQKSLPLTQVTV